MSKSKKNSPAKKSEAKKSVQRWSLGVFKSAAREGELVVAYVRVDGSPMPSVAKKVIGKKALFNASYKGITYAAAHERLMKEAKAAGKLPKVDIEPKAEKKNSPKMRKAA